jgi:hypothetical protein
MRPGFGTQTRPGRSWAFFYSAVAILAWLILAGPARVQADGVWTPEGVPASNTLAAQTNAKMISDGAGGVILVWEDHSQGSANSDIYAQRFSADGQPLWGVTGTAVCTAPDIQSNPVLTSDGAQGCVIAWQDRRDGSAYYLYAQRLDALGNACWDAGGHLLASASSSVNSPGICSDLAGGAIIGNYFPGGIFAQRFDHQGNLLWSLNYTSAGIGSWVWNPANFVSDQAGGVILSWNTYYSGGAAWGIRVDASGNTRWAQDGVWLAPSGVMLSPDGNGGVFLTWQIYSSGSRLGYVQHVDAQGNTLWSESGVPLSNIPDQQNGETILGLSDGSALAAWSENRNGSYDIFAQKFSPAGVPQWAANGLPVCTAANEQSSPAVAQDGSGSILLAWQDMRQGNYDIYAQRLSLSGDLAWGSGIPLTRMLCQQQTPRLAGTPTGAVALWYDTRFGSATSALFLQKIIRPSPVVTAVSPSAPPQGQKAALTVTGNYFKDIYGTVAYAALTRTGQPAVAATQLAVADAATLTCALDLTTAATGLWSLLLVDTLGQTSTAAAFTVTPPAINRLEWVSAPAGGLFTSTTGNFLGQINCACNGTDALTSITLENIGTATTGDVAALYLWYQAAGSSSGITFNPAAAQKLGTFKPGTSNRRWTLNLNQLIQDGSALYLTADIAGNAQVGDTLQLALFPGQAVFTSGTTLPSQAILNASVQTLARGATLTLQALPTGKVNAVPGQTGLPLGQIQISNTSGVAFVLHSLRLALLDSAGRALKFEQVFSNLALKLSGAAVADLSAPYTGDALLTFSQPLSLPSQTQVNLDLQGDLPVSSAVVKFQCGLPDGQCLDAGALLADPVTGQTFPLLWPAVSVRQPDLKSTFSNYPNPFHPGAPGTKFTCFLARPAHVKVSVFDLAGKLVKEVVAADEAGGWLEAPWDGANAVGYRVTSGVYLAVIDVQYTDGGREILKRKIAAVR